MIRILWLPEQDSKETACSMHDVDDFGDDDMGAAESAPIVQDDRKPVMELVGLPCPRSMPILVCNLCFGKKGILEMINMNHATCRSSRTHSRTTSNAQHPDHHHALKMNTTATQHYQQQQMLKPTSPRPQMPITKTRCPSRPRCSHVSRKSL